MGWRARPVSLLVLCGLLLSSAIAAGTGVMLSRLHDRALAEAERGLQNLALVLAKEADRAFQSVELVETSLKERVQALGITSSESYERQMSGHDVHLLLKEKASGMPQVGAFSLFSAEGKLFNFSRFWPIPQISVTDRDFFKELKSNPQLKTFIGQPVRNRATGTWAIHMAQKLSGPNGEFLGLASGAMEMEYFQRLFETVALGKDGSIALLRDDAVLLASHPLLDPAIVRSEADRGVFKEVVSQASYGAVRRIGLIDGEERLISARRLDHYPFVVMTTTTTRAALADWRFGARYLIGTAILLCLVIGGTVFLSGQQVEKRLRRQKLQLDTALNNMSQGLCMFDSTARLVVCNERYLHTYGLSATQVKPGCTLSEVLDHRIAAGTFSGDPKQYGAALLATIAQGKTAGQLAETGDGRTIAILNQPMPGGGWVVTHEDISERRRAEKQIEHMAHHDALTDLPNRVLLQERLEQALARVHRGECLAVLYLDLDFFKNVNDTLGHSIGDELLKAVADRLRGCVRATDTVARLGGDEFAIIQTALEQPTDAAVLARSVRAAIGMPYDLNGHQVVIDTSIGIAVAPSDGTKPEQLLKSADMAAYEAKTQGRGAYRFFEPEMDARIKARRTLELDLRNAFVNGEFEPYYQPIVNLETNEVSGFEALLRWHHPERGMISPAEFIPVAEDIGLIIPLGEWVLRTACAHASSWPDPIRLAVNLSPAQLTTPNLVQVVVSALAESGLPACRLELEITEAVLMQDTAATLATLHMLRKLGVRISMDDFGTGYSSLSYLRSFPFDKIKIDRCFIKDLPEGDDSLAIVRAVAGLASSLSMTTTAEGVETQLQLDQVRALGCTEMQGYLFSRPRPIGEITQLFLPPPARTASVA